MSDKRLYLASKSPRRREIMDKLGLEYSVLAGDVDETLDMALGLDAALSSLAKRKASAALAAAGGGVVVGADTVVVLDGEIFGKPVDATDASRMLCALSGRSHEVKTGVCVLDGDGRCALHTETTRVFFAELSRERIERYIAGGEPFGKAGAYAVQGGAAGFVRRIEGCYYNVVGLPAAALLDMLAGFGFGV